MSEKNEAAAAQKKATYLNNMGGPAVLIILLSLNGKGKGTREVFVTCGDYFSVCLDGADCNGSFSKRGGSCTGGGPRYKAWRDLGKSPCGMAEGGEEWGICR